MLNHLQEYNIILASNSPRRKELLAGLDIPFTVVVNNDVEEVHPDHVAGVDVALHLAIHKANSYLLAANDLLITADTIVVLPDNSILEKPINLHDAACMLKKLSGSIHLVATGVCIRTSNDLRSFLVVSEVEFDILDDDEITYYVNKYSPLDKAGAYGVQEWIGYIGVKNIKGSYFNIMGLPVQRLYRELKKIKG